MAWDDLGCFRPHDVRYMYVGTNSAMLRPVTPRRELTHSADRQTRFFGIHLNVNQIVRPMIRAQPDFTHGLWLITNVAAFKEFFDV